MEKSLFPTRNWIPVIIPYWTKREKRVYPTKNCPFSDDETPYLDTFFSLFYIIGRLLYFQLTIVMMRNKIESFITYQWIVYKVQSPLPCIREGFEKL